MARKPHAVAWEWAREGGPQERPMHSGRGVSPSGLHKKNMSVQSHWIGYVKLRHAYTYFLVGCLSSKENNA